MPLHPDFLRAPITHRALHDRSPARPENSLAAILAAADAGYGIEVDLQLTSDDKAVVFHDRTLDRMTGETGAVRARTQDDLGRIALLGGTEHIPTLRQMLDGVAGRVPILLELKTQEGLVGPLEEAVAADLAGYKGPVAVMSFDPRMIAHMARIAPGVVRGITSQGAEAGEWTGQDAATRARLAEIADFDSVGASFISHDRKDLDNPAVTRLKARGVPVLCWTVRSPDEEAAARRVADNITFEDYLAPFPAD